MVDCSSFVALIGFVTTEQAVLIGLGILVLRGKPLLTFRFLDLLFDLDLDLVGDRRFEDLPRLLFVLLWSLLLECLELSSL